MLLHCKLAHHRACLQNQHGTFQLMLSAASTMRICLVLCWQICIQSALGLIAISVQQ